MRAGRISPSLCVADYRGRTSKSPTDETPVRSQAEAHFTTIPKSSSPLDVVTTSSNLPTTGFARATSPRSVNFAGPSNPFIRRGVGGASRSLDEAHTSPRIPAITSAAPQIVVVGEEGRKQWLQASAESRSTHPAGGASAQDSAQRWGKAYTESDALELQIQKWSATLFNPSRSSQEAESSTFTRTRTGALRQAGDSAAHVDFGSANAKRASGGFDALPVLDEGPTRDLSRTNSFDGYARRLIADLEELQTSHVSALNTAMVQLRIARSLADSFRSVTEDLVHLVNQKAKARNNRDPDPTSTSIATETFALDPIHVKSAGPDSHSKQKEALPSSSSSPSASPPTTSTTVPQEMVRRDHLPSDEATERPLKQRPLLAKPRSSTWARKRRHVSMPELIKHIDSAADELGLNMNRLEWDSEYGD